MRLGTEAALKGARPRLGFSGRLNTAFIERVNLTVRDARLSAGTPHLGNFSTGLTASGPSRVVACRLTFCASSRITARGARAATRARAQTRVATLSPPH